MLIHDVRLDQAVPQANDALAAVGDLVIVRMGGGCHAIELF